MNSGWTTCASPSHEINAFKNSTVWKNRLVALSDRTLYIYNHNPRVDELQLPQWSMRGTPYLFGSRFFLNLGGDLCLDERYDKKHFIIIYEVWCLTDFEST